ncbi:MAG: dicarboxylate/amino acid:cation symporter [Aeromonas sp.]
MRSFFKIYGFSSFFLAAMFVAGSLGAYFGEATIAVKPIGDMFLNLMFVVIVPLVFFSIVNAVSGNEHGHKLGNILTVTALVFITTALLASLVGYGGVMLFNPVEGIDSQALMAAFPLSNEAPKPLGEMLVNMFTVSEFYQLFTKAHLLPLIVFAFLFGIAINLSGSAATPVRHFMRAMNQVCLKLVNLIMYAAPLGLGCSFAYTIGMLGGSILTGFFNAFVLYTVLALLYYAIFYSLYALVAGGRAGVKTFWRNIITPSLSAIATASSAACISVNLVAAKDIGVSEDVADLVVPLGANTHKDGSVIGGAVKIAFIMSLMGQSLGGVEMFLLIIGLSFLVGVVMGSIPGGGLTGETLICTMLGLPAGMIPILAVIGNIIDIPATLVNSSGNVACAMLVERFSKGKVTPS